MAINRYKVTHRSTIAGGRGIHNPPTHTYLVIRSPGQQWSSTASWCEGAAQLILGAFAWKDIHIFLYKGFFTKFESRISNSVFFCRRLRANSDKQRSSPSCGGGGYAGICSSSQRVSTLTSAYKVTPAVCNLF